MNTVSSFSEQLGRVFTPTGRGVLDVVDHLLELCQEPGLQLDWYGNRCRVRTLGAQPQESNDIPLPKSIFRAILARVAVLCNERRPNSVSPYRGQGALVVGGNPARVIRATFVNTPAEQRLVLVPSKSDEIETADGRDGDAARVTTESPRTLSAPASEPGDPRNRQHPEDADHAST
jgi:hypothetical protein